MAKRAKKQTHLQRLVDSMKTISTSATPVSNLKKVTPTKRDLPKRLQPTDPRGAHRRILVPDAIRSLDEPRSRETPNPTMGRNRDNMPIPTRDYFEGNRLRSYDPRLGAWDRLNPHAAAELRNLEIAERQHLEAAREWSEYRSNQTSVRDRNRKITTAKKNNKLINKIRNSKANIGKVVTSLKGSRSGYSKSRGSR